MASVNVFIGGTGVNLAVLVKAYADFYDLKEYPRIFAIDTDASSQDIAQRSLGRALVLSAPGFLDRIKDKVARRWLQESWAELWDASERRTLSFGDPLLRSGAQVVRGEFEAPGGLWTLRGAGWIAFEDIDEKNKPFVRSIVTALHEIYQESQGRESPVLNVIASLAGGTGSGLFIPLIAAVRKQYGSSPLLVHLHVVLPSAFTNNWRSDASEQVFRTRGNSGAFAAYREILLLAEEADKHSSPEPRSVLGYPYRPGMIDKVIWWGRRAIDARSRADDVFYEAGKLVTLLNDRPVANRLLPGAGVAEARRVAGFASIEHPVLEWAQAIAATAIGHMATGIREGKPASAAERVLAQVVPDAEQPPLLRFIQQQRSENQALSSLLPVGDGRFDYEKVKTELLSTLRSIRNDTPSDEQLRNRVEDFQGGTAVGSRDNYRATTDTAWNDYCDKVVGRLRALEEMTVGEMRAYCTWLPFAADRWVADSVAAVVRASGDPAIGLPSLEKIKRAVVDVVEDLDRARFVFIKPPDQSIMGGPWDEQLVGLDQLQVKVEERKRTLTEMKDSNPGFQRRPPTGLLYHPALQVIAVVVGLGFLISALLQTGLASAPILGGVLSAGGAILAFLSGLFGRATAGFGQVFRGPSLDLPPSYGAVISFAVFLLLRFFRDRAFKEKPELRQEAEEELKQAWAVHTEAKMLAMLWDAAVTTCVRIAGDVPAEQAASGRVASAGSSLSSIFALIETGSGWLEDLALYAEQKKQAATRARPNWVIPVTPYRDVELAQLVGVLPRVELEAKLTPALNVKSIDDLALTFSADEQNGNNGHRALGFRGWKPLKERSDEEHRAIEHALGRFYTDIEKAILPRVSEENLVARTLNEAMSWSAGELAQRLDDLAKRASERGPAAELTKTVQMTQWLCVPDDAVAQRVRDALSIVKTDATLTHAKELPVDVLVSRNVGESIALIAVGQFAQDVTLKDIDEAARDSYYGVGHRPGSPRETFEYSAKNTEFHIIPELSTAARAETGAGRDHPLSPLLVQRLYGSHQAVTAYPSMIEAFYLCRAREYLKWLPEGSSVTYTLRIGEHAVPLVSVNDLRLPVAPGDELGEARSEMAGLDAFRTCFTAISLSFREPPFTDLPEGARIRTDLWPTDRNSRSIQVCRVEMLKQWRELRGAEGEAERTKIYSAMRKLAQEDDHRLGGRLRGQWALLTKACFDQGESILAGKAGIWDVGATPVG